MKTPVLIAARNEAEHIGNTVRSLPDEVEAIVIPNGCYGYDRTAAIADEHGATVLEGSPEGKLPALQFGLDYLGERALGPLLLLDADSRPIAPRNWITRMLQARQESDAEKPAIVGGPMFFNSLDPLTSAWRNLGHWRRDFISRHDPKAGVCGRNVLLNLKDESTLEYILALPHFWPREDAALRDAITNQDGQVITLLNPLAAVLTSDERFPGLATRIKLGREASVELATKTYLDEAAPGSTPYDGPHQLPTARSHQLAA